MPKPKPQKPTKPKHPIHSNRLRLTIFITIFAAVSVFGISFITGNQQQSGVGNSQASAIEPADINNDNTVNVLDLSYMLGKWKTTDTLADLNQDGLVNVLDLSRLLAKWGSVASITNWLPFDMPDSGILRASNKKVFANYFPQPISLDNGDPATDLWSQWLNNQYGADKTDKRQYWPSHGGAYRDRPIGRSPITCVNNPSKTYECWMLEDMKIEVRNAISAGLDGFAIDLLGDSNNVNWKYYDALIDAGIIEDPGFKIILTPDVISGYWNGLDANTMAKHLKYFAIDSIGNYKSNMWLDNRGRLVIAPFPAQQKGIQFWADLNNEFKTITGGKELANWVGLADYTYSKTTTSFQEWTKPYTESPVFDAITYWGSASAKDTIISESKLRADIAHGLDSDVLSVDSSGQPKKWIQPLHVIDQRPLLHGKESLPGYYVESKALKSLRDQWQAAINYADHAQFITWNDYSETAISPSLGHGYGILDISSYYLTKFKTGSFPVIKRDAVYLIHRNQLSNSTYKCSSYIAPKIPCTLLMQKNNTSVSDFENVEAMVFLTSPATLEITVGSAVYTHNLGSGLTVVNSPLGVGKVKAKLVRNSQTLESVTSPYIVTNNPEVQDMQYHIFSSLRD